MREMIRAHKALDAWYPGKPQTREELLEAEVIRLRRRVAQLEHESYLQSWRDNPDRMGGAFTEYEIKRAREWR